MNVADEVVREIKFDCEYKGIKYFKIYYFLTTSQISQTLFTLLGIGVCFLKPIRSDKSYLGISKKINESVQHFSTCAKYTFKQYD